MAEAVRPPLDGVPPSDREDVLQADPWGDYSKAGYMALDHKPVTEQAIGLCSELADCIEEWERAARQRRYQRHNHKLERFRRAVGLVVGDLISVARKSPQRWLFRPMNPDEFTGEEVSYRTFRACFRALRKMGLIEVLPGYHTHAEADAGEVWSYGKCTRLRSTADLLALASQHGVEPREAGQHFRRMLPHRPLVLRSASRRIGHRKIPCRRMKIKGTRRSQELEAQVREINDFIAQHDLQNGKHGGYRRIFNGGDRPDFAWNKGGRLYSQEDSYQQLKEEQRLEMLIDGEPVVEIDVRASYLTILYARRGWPMAEDPYEIDGIPREVVKAWVTITLGHNRFHTRWPNKTAREYREKHGKQLGRAYPIRAVQAAVLKAHPILADWPDQELTCLDLMHVESEAIIETMLRLKRERAVVCLSVHDSIIVPGSEEHTAVATLKEEYRRSVGAEPALKVNRTDGSVEIVPAPRQSDLAHLGRSLTAPQVRLEHAFGGPKTGGTPAWHHPSGRPGAPVLGRPNGPLGRFGREGDHVGA